MKYKSNKQWLLSGFLLIVGIILLLMNLGVISLEIKQLLVELIPVAFVFIGLRWLIDCFMKKSLSKLLFGLFLFSYGLLLLFDRFNIIEFSYQQWWKLWPILIISFAIKGIFKGHKVRIHFSTDDPTDQKPDYNVTSPSEEEKDRYKYNDQKGRKFNQTYKGSLVGDMKFKEPNWPLESMNLYNAIGDYLFDFSKAYIPEGETPVIVKGWVGDCKVLVPENVPVEINVKVKVGDIKLFDQKSSELGSDLFYRSPDYETATKKIKMTIEMKIGSIRINRV